MQNIKSKSVNEYAEKSFCSSRCRQTTRHESVYNSWARNPAAACSVSPYGTQTHTHLNTRLKSSIRWMETVRPLRMSECEGLQLLTNGLLYCTASNVFVFIILTLLVRLNEWRDVIHIITWSITLQSFPLSDLYVTLHNMTMLVQM